MLPIRTCAGQPVPKRRFSERRSLRVRDARCSSRLRTDPVVSTDPVVLAEPDGMVRDALTCIQAVMHARPTRAMIRPYSITVALDPPATRRFTRRFRSGFDQGSRTRDLLKLWMALRPPDPLRPAP